MATTQDVVEVLTAGFRKLLKRPSYLDRQGPWTGNANLGTSASFSPQLNNRRSILKLPEWGMPQMWTVALGIDTSRMTWAPADTGFEIVAEIIAGSGGSTQTIEVDWENGNQVSIATNSIDIVARHQVGVGALFAVSSGLQLTVTLSQGVRPGPTMPQRSYWQPVVGGGADSPAIPIPPFARRLELVSNTDDLYNAASFIQFRATPLVAMASGRRYTADLRVLPDGFAIPGFSRYVHFHNGAGGGVPFSWNFKIGL